MNLIDRQWFPVYLLQGSVITCCEHNNNKKIGRGEGDKTTMNAQQVEAECWHSDFYS